MNRNTIKRLVVTIGVTAGFLTITAAQTEARPVPSRPVATVDALNHSEPTLNRN
jgi:hypothetical protein